MALRVLWKRLNSKAVIPSKASPGAACFDLVACLPEGQSILIEHGRVSCVPTGLAVEIPQGFELQVRARSGLALKQGVALVNGIGTIDSDYRGEVQVILTRLVPGSFEIKSGDRIAQALVSPVLDVVHKEVEELSQTDRGVGGFGSTGVGVKL